MTHRTKPLQVSSKPGMSWRKQFAKPEGPLGWMAGRVMAMTNSGRSEWVFSLLELRPEERVLEIGFGPGTDLERASQMAAFVAGVDHSDLMVKQAARRNARGRFERDASRFSSGRRPGCLIRERISTRYSPSTRRNSGRIRWAR